MVSSLRSLMQKLWRKCTSRLPAGSVKVFLKKCLPIAELLLIGLWALWIGREYLVFDPTAIPAGREFLSAIQTHDIWNQVRECGACAFWNGSTSGGYPAFTEIYGSALHPVVAVTTSILGVINGSKVGLVFAFWLAGVAQWWLSRELELGWVARMWASLTAVAGGHLAGRMEIGVFGVVLSTAAASLVIPALIRVSKKGGRRSAVLLGIALASALLAGQGYLQAGLVAMLPALAVLLLDKRLKVKSAWKPYLLGGVLALLLAAPLLVPTLHFMPNFVKHDDPDFGAAQEISYLPLNLVISDADFYRSEGVLGKLPYPYLYTLFIGWVPVLLAVYGLAVAKGAWHRILWFFAAATGMVFLMASGVLLKILLPVLPEVGIIRNPSLIAGLAVPLILGMAAYGLDRLLSWSWPVVSIGRGGNEQRAPFRASLRWLIVLPLVFNLRAQARFTGNWVFTKPLPAEVTPILDALVTDDLQWIAPPYGEHPFVTPAVVRGLKVSPGIKTWQWEGREVPEASLAAARGDAPPGPYSKIGETVAANIYGHEDADYAFRLTEAGLESCRASGSGGMIEVVCDGELPGYLVVKENMWSGWRAWRDGVRVPLLANEWLEVVAPAGNHVYSFRYLPWDVPLGMLLSLAGMIMAGLLWFVPSRKQPEDHHQRKAKTAK
ncbi:MAG: hypothetical protein PVJ07_08920 [Anaerolineales bacterium]